MAVEILEFNAKAVVGAQITGRVIDELAGRLRADRNANQAVARRAVVEHLGRCRAARRRCDMMRAVADAVVVERLRAPRPVRVLQPVVARVPERLIVRRRDIVPDVREIEIVGAWAILNSTPNGSKWMVLR